MRILAPKEEKKNWQNYFTIKKSDFWKYALEIKLKTNYKLPLHDLFLVLKKLVNDDNFVPISVAFA